uniref:Ig-like domain-containing protein n=1 Tax=Periophthalmus magnuspinnatus TaxID=409849 RepID=A0A3B4B0T8_9GOBI
HSWGDVLEVWLLFIHCFGAGQEFTLTQPASVTVQPGHTLTISCTVSYSGTTAWIRQPAGKPMEWIGQNCAGCTATMKPSLKNKFSIEHPSSKTVTLNGQNMQPGDTAVYYCARYPQSHKVHLELYKNTSWCYSL